jgi:hypothetical protein
MITPAVEEAYGRALARYAAAENAAVVPCIVYVGKGVAQANIAELMSDGDWHGVDEIAEAGGIAPNNLQKYLRRLPPLERRDLPRGGGQGGRGHAQWRLA